MAALWYMNLIRAHALAGAGQAVAAVDVPVEAARVLLGTQPASSEADPSCFAVELDPDSMSTLGTYFFGAPVSADTASFFVKIAGVWEAGPVVSGFDLSGGYQNPIFPWPKAWVIGVLQSFAKTNAPFPSKAVRVAGGFPRDPMTWPAITVQVDEVQASSPVIGASFGELRDREVLGRNEDVRLSIIGWCETAEERDALAAWLGTAMVALCDQATYYGFQEPSYSLSESEDMGDNSPAGKPIFIVSASLNGSRWAAIVRPVPVSVGPVMVTSNHGFDAPADLSSPAVITIP